MFSFVLRLPYSDLYYLARSREMPILMLPFPIAPDVVVTQARR
jgi:hypothetical protein